MDNSPALQLIIILILLALSAFFSSSETALTTVSHLKLRSLADDGNKKASKVLKVTENSSKLLSAILVGNNIVNISASALATTFCTNMFGSKYIGVSTGILTLLVLIFGEISPKTLATQYALQLSMVVVYPISWLMTLLTPVIFLLNILTGAIFKLFRIKHPVAIGVSCGTGAHAMGTSRAREFGEIEEAMSGLSIAVCGLLTVVGASIFAMIRF